MRNAVSKISTHRIADLVIKSLALTEIEKNLDALFTPESIGATPEEFNEVIEYLNNVNPDSGGQDAVS